MYNDFRKQELTQEEVIETCKRMRKQRWVNIEKMLDTHLATLPKAIAAIRREREETQKEMESLQPKPYEGPKSNPVVMCELEMRKG